MSKFIQILKKYSQILFIKFIISKQTLSQNLKLSQLYEIQQISNQITQIKQITQISQKNFKIKYQQLKKKNFHNKYPQIYLFPNYRKAKHLCLETYFQTLYYQSSTSNRKEANMQICFILDNSLTMLQKASNNDMSFFDLAKHSLQTAIKSFHQANILRQEDIIHLFVTSSTQPISSYEHNDLHLMYQVFFLILHINSQRIYNVQSPHFLRMSLNPHYIILGNLDALMKLKHFWGIVKGQFVSLLQFFTQLIGSINEIYIKFIRLILIKNCNQDHNTHLSQQNFLHLILKFKNQVENQKESIMMDEIMKKINGELLYAYKIQNIISIIKRKVEEFRPYLAMKIQPKQYKIHNKQIVKVQLPGQYQAIFLEKIKQLGKQASRFRYFPSDESSLFINTTPQKKRFQIPLPFQIIPKHFSNNFQSQANNIIIDQFQSLRYQIDFSKQYVGEIDPIMKYFFNMYRVENHKELDVLGQDIALNLGSCGNLDKKFPVFYQKRKQSQQLLIGFLRLCSNTSTSHLLAWQLHLSLSNFINLNSNLRLIMQRQPNAEQYFQNYVSTLPIYYHRFLRSYLQHMGVNLSNQGQMFQNINSKPIGITNLKFYDNRLNEKRKIANLFKINKEKHQNNQTQCCAIYSRNFYQFQKQRSQFYQFKKQGKSTITNNNKQIDQFLQQSIVKLSQFKKKLSICDYFTILRIQSTPLKKQYQKYNIRRDDDDLNEIVGDVLGNPFKRLNKKIKINDEAQSIWVQPNEIQQMKLLLLKQKQIISNIETIENQQQPQDSKDTQISYKLNKSKNLYDQLVQTKQHFKNHIRNHPENIVEITQSIQSNHVQTYQQQSSSGSNNINIKQYTSKKQDKSSTQKQDKNSQILSISMKQVQGGKLAQSNRQNQSQIEIGKYQQINNQPELINEINQKFKMQKKILFPVPDKLLSIDQYVKNKKIIKEILSYKCK